MRLGHWSLLALTILGVLTPGPLAAQRPLTARGRQDLAFGPLLGGVPMTISRTDRRSAGRFEVRGQRNAEVQVDLTLPAAMASGRGDLLPLQFGAGDGGFSDRPAFQTQRAFDPRAPLIVNLGRRRRLFIFLGGTALPAAQQAAGNYSAPITLTVAYTGN